MPKSLLHPLPGFEWAARLTGWRVEEDRLIAVTETSSGHRVDVTFRAESPEVWRITCAPDGGRGQAPPLPPLPLVVSDIGPAVMLDVQETDEGVTARGASAAPTAGVPTALTLVINRDPWCISFRDAEGRVVCRENPFDVDGLDRLFIRPLGFTRAEQGQADDEHPVAQMTESFHLRADEHLFGLGEKFTPLDKRGQRIISWTVDALGAASERAYKNVPLLISTRGYGLFLNTGRRITYELGTESCETYTLAVDGPYLDLYLIYGPTPAAILERYTALTGRAPVPPKWSFGLWLSGSGIYRDEAAFATLVAGLAEHDIPCDVIHVDPWWMRWRKYADFEWDRQAFPEPKRFAADLHRQGLKLSAWQHPYISVESDLFLEGRAKGYFARKPDGSVYVIDYGLSLSSLLGGITGDEYSPTQVASRETSWNAPVAIIDLTQPEAVAWYKSLMRAALRSGLDAFKTDFGEDIPVDAVFANGMTGAEMHNLYPLLYNQVVFDVTLEVKGAGVVWGRSGYASSQRYPTCWSGDPACDWDSLAFTIRGGLSLGLSGVPFWSNDIGGYRGHPSAELYIRWAQFGLLCSHARCHGESQREPWFFGEQALAIFRRYARLRYQLFPYLYSCAHEAAATGLPVLRAMPLAFPDDPNCYDKDLQYLLGPWLLVAPIYDESSQRHVYLPEGRWIDYWSEQTFTGPANITVHASLDTLPLFVRGGAIVPMIPPTINDVPIIRIPTGLLDPLILDVYPHGETSYRLYEDEGITDITCTCDDSGVTLVWTGGPPRTTAVRFHTVPSSEFQVSGSGLQVQVESDGLVRVETTRVSAARIRLNW